MAARRPPPDKYEVQDAAHTIKRAHEIRKDKHLMRHVRKHVKKEAASMQQLAQALQGAGSAGPPQAPGGMGGMTQPAPSNFGQAFGP